MMIRLASIVVCATSLMLYGQVNSVPDKAVISIFPPPPVAFEELKQHLGLTDAQVEQLRKLLEERSNERQELYKQIHEKQMEVNALLRSGSRDVARIGQLTIDIHTLSMQQPQPAETWRQRALAVLTPEQRTKLSSLDQAMKLSTAAYQAVMVDLIDPAPPGLPRILATDAVAAPALPAPGTPVPMPRPLP